MTGHISRILLYQFAGVPALILLFQAGLTVVAAPRGTNQVVVEPMVSSISLWPAGKMPGHGAATPEHLMPSRGDGVIRIVNVSHPTLTIYPAPAITNRSPRGVTRQAHTAGPGKDTPWGESAVIVCPGGAYQHLAVNREGSEIATWLNSLGITALVLKYRVPNNRHGALQDVERAVRLVRAHEKEWHVDDAKIGVMGFSAGGHLCAHLSTTYEKPAYTAIDETDKLSCRPDFVVLVYPAYLGRYGKLAREFTVSSNVPPTFIAHSRDDTNYVWGTRLYVAALSAHHVAHKFVLFQTGGHGYGLHCKKEAKVWPVRCREWLTKIKVLPANTP